MDMGTSRYSRLVVGAVAAALVFALVGSAAAQGKPVEKAPAAKAEAKAKTAAPEAKAEAKVENAWYLVISPHTMEQCLAALDGVHAGGNDLLARYDWGCMAGDHTGYLKVQAAGEAEALQSVPELVRGQAKAIKLSKISAADLKKFHEMHH